MILRFYRVPSPLQLTSIGVPSPMPSALLLPSIACYRPTFYPPIPPYAIEGDRKRGLMTPRPLQSLKRKPPSSPQLPNTLASALRSFCGV